MKSFNVHFNNFSLRHEVASGEDFGFECQSSIYDGYIHEISWKKNDYQLTAARESTQSKYSNGERIYFKNVTKHDEGKYECIFQRSGSDGKYSESNAHTITVVASSPSKIQPYLMKNAKMELQCTADGYPAPNISWFKGNQALPDNISSQNILWTQNEKFLVSSLLKLNQTNSNGNFTCVARNKAGEDASSIMISNERKFLISMILLIEIIFNDFFQLATKPR